MRLNTTQLIFGTGTTLMSKPEKAITRKKHLNILLKKMQKFLSKFTNPTQLYFFKKESACDQLEFISGCHFI